MKWNKINLRQYEDMKQVLEDEQDDFKKTCYLIKIAYNVELEDVPLEDLDKYTNGITELFKERQKVNSIKKYYILNNKRYMVTKLNNLSIAQFMDYQFLANNAENNVLKLLSIFLVPEGHKYNDGYDLEETFEDLYELPIEDVNGILNFQLGLLKKLFKCTLASLIVQTIMMKGMSWKAKKITVKNLLTAYRGTVTLLG